jgi:hypothetical protein
MDYTELRNISNQLANLQIGRLNNDYWNRRYFMYFDETNNTKKLLIKLQNMRCPQKVGQINKSS